MEDASGLRWTQDENGNWFVRDDKNGCGWYQQPDGTWKKGIDSESHYPLHDPAPGDTVPGTPPSVIKNNSDAISAVKGQYQDYLDPTRVATMSPSDVTTLSSADFEAKARAAGGDATEVSNWGGYYDPSTGKIYVRSGSEDRGLTNVHEFIHKASNPSVGTKLGSGLNEGMTEHFSNQIASQRNLSRGQSLYNSDGRVKVIEALERAVGRDPVAKAYFGTGDAPIDKLGQAVDNKFGAGTWQKVQDLCNRTDAAGKPAPDFQGAEALLTPKPAAPAPPAAKP